MMIFRFLLIFVLILKCSFYRAQSNFVKILESDSETDIIRKAAQIRPSERQLQWQKLELTAFIHFGMNTFTGREWGNGTENPALFNPTQLDTDQWVKVLKAAGFKQIVFTAKHHDGFCLWPTETTQHSLKNSPWKNGNGDVVKELAESCRKYGLGFGIYLSPWDMNAVSYGTPAYNNFFEAQLKELLTNYGTVKEVWFDGANGEGANGQKQIYDFQRWYSLIRELQPEAVIAVMGPDVRWVGTETGKGRAQEWSVVPGAELNVDLTAQNSQKEILFSPAKDLTAQVLGDREQILKAKTLVWYPAETDVSIMNGWFYSDKHQVKTAQQLLDIYFTSVGMNSVLLLNIPPDPRGMIPDSIIQSLEEWTALRHAIFKNNLLKNSNIQSKDFSNAKFLLDGQSSTSAKAKNRRNNYTIELSLPKDQTFNVLMLQEDISKGQRIEAFAAEYFDGTQWHPFAEGTTVGHKRLLRTPNINAAKVRIRILKSRLKPNLSELGLFYQQP